MRDGEERRGRGGWRSFEHPMLVVLDMQRFFLDSGSHAFVPGGVEIIENIRRLAGVFLSKGLPAVYTRHGLSPGGGSVMCDWWRDTLYRGEERWHLDERVLLEDPARPGVGGVVVDKETYSAFVGTPLEDIVKGEGVRDVVVTGVMTHLCVETTVRDAFTRNLRPWTVVDAVAERTEDMHAASLRAMADGFSMLVTTREVCTMLESLQDRGEGRGKKRGKEQKEGVL